MYCVADQLCAAKAARLLESAGQQHDAEIARDVSSGNAVGVDGTPAFLVNDYFFVGSIPLEILRVIVDRALSDAGA